MEGKRKSVNSEHNKGKRNPKDGRNSYHNFGDYFYNYKLRD